MNITDRDHDSELSSDRSSVQTIKRVNCDVNYLAPIMVTVKVNGVPVPMQLDTGSCITLISERVWVKLGKFRLSPVGEPYKSYTGHMIQFLGEQFVTVSCKGITRKLTVYVTPGDSQVLMGRDWIGELKLKKYTLSELQNSSVQKIQSQGFQTKLEALMSEFSDIFSPGLGHCLKVTAHLYLKDNAVPVFKKARPVPFALRQEVTDELNRLISEGILEPVEQSEWAAPLVVVRKPNGKLRLCADFSTGLNDALAIQSYPLPTSEELFSRLSGGKHFTTLDLTEAYLSIPVDEESKKLLVINTHMGLLRYTRLCFGVASAPAIFQGSISNAMKGLKGCGWLLDDCIVTGENEEEHLLVLRQVFQKIREYGFRLNREKCKFLQPSVRYLGHTISAAGVSTSGDKVEAIVKMPRPTDKKSLESFLGMVNYYSKFIDKFSYISYPLNLLRRTGVEFNWSAECEAAFISLKNALKSAPVLVHYDLKLPVVVAADASSVGIGCSILHRFPDFSEKPIAYASKTLTKAEQMYSQIEREALAIIFAVKKFRQYLLGREFILQTDHQPLLALFGSRKGVPVLTASRLQRWALCLMGYQYKIEYVPTKKFGKVDGLSRLPAGEDIEFEEAMKEEQGIVAALQEDSCSKLPLRSGDIALETERDPVLKELVRIVREGWPKAVPQELKPYQSKASAYTIQDGCLLFGIRVVVPNKFRPYVLEHLHRSHSGMVRMKAEAREYVWWPGLSEDIENFVRKCEACNTLAREEPHKQLTHAWPQEGSPWSRVHLDFAGPFFGKMFLLIVDSFSKWIEVIPVSSATSEATIAALKKLISRYGYFNVIVTDNGTAFTSRKFKEFCEKYASLHLTTPAYHPRSNGQVERYVGTFKRSLMKIRHATVSGNFDEHLRNFLFTYRTTPHTTTGKAPCELFLGRSLRTKLTLLKPEPRPSQSSSPAVLKGFKEGDKVYVRDYSDKKIPWRKGRVKMVLGKNTWLVVVDGKEVKKHATQLKKRGARGSLT